MRLRSFIVGWLAAICAVPASAAEPVADLALKEAVVFNLLRFVEWPEDVTGTDLPIRFCVPAGRGGAPAMTSLDGQRIGRRLVTLIRLERSLDHLSRCDAIYLAAADPALLASVAAGARRSPLLVVAEGDQAVQQGATVALAIAGGRIVFDVNLAAARAANLVISSKLLRLARVVVE